MSHQHTAINRGGGEEARPVYHVVQQVVHAQPVPQHRPVYFDQQRPPPPHLQQPSNLPYHPRPSHRGPPNLANVRSSSDNHIHAMHVSGSVGDGRGTVVNQGQMGQPYYGHQQVSSKPAVSASYGISSQANVINLKSTPSITSSHHNQATNIEIGQHASPNSTSVHHALSSSTGLAVAVVTVGGEDNGSVNAPLVSGSRSSPNTAKVRRGLTNSECLVSHPTETVLVSGNIVSQYFCGTTALYLLSELGQKRLHCTIVFSPLD